MALTSRARIVLQGQELLTSNMMVSMLSTRLRGPALTIWGKIFPMAVMKRAIPWWSLPLNWLVGMYVELPASVPELIQGEASHLWKSCWLSLLRRDTRQV